MTRFTRFIGEVSKYAVWTSASDGDLFEANSIEIDEVNVYFCMYSKIIKTYVAEEFIRYNPKLFEVVKEK
jgi:hypothetical protein